MHDEVAYKIKPLYEEPTFTYSHGWALHLTGVAFMAILAAAVTNVMIYKRRQPYPKHIVDFILELEEKSKCDFSGVKDKGCAETGTPWFVY